MPSTIFRQQNFPNLRDAGRIKSRKKKKFGPPFDIEDRWFRVQASEENFPFESVDNDALKIKFTPIRLSWA